MGGHDCYSEKVSTAVLQMFALHRRGINMVKHQIDSFDEFISYRIRNIINSCNSLDVMHNYIHEVACYQHRLTIKLVNPRITRPTVVEKDGSVTLLTPHICRMRGMNYSAGLYVDVNVTCKSVVSTTPFETATHEKCINNVCIGRIPIMVKSKYCVTQSVPVLGLTDCRYDYGGFFVVNGTEKVIVSNDRMAENQTFVFLNTKTNLTYSHCAEIRSVAWNNDSSGTVKSLVLRVSARPNQFGRYVRVALPHSKQDVPVVTLFRALGIETDAGVVKLLTTNCSQAECDILHQNIIGSLAESCDIRCARDAIEVLMRGMNLGNSNASHASRLEYVRNMIARDILPHVGKEFRSKALYLAYMLRRLLRCVSGVDQPDDRDSYINKRVDTPGIMMASLFRVHFVRMVKELRNSLTREVSSGAWKPSGGFINVVNKINISKHIKQSIIESGMKYALATGNWNVKGMTGSNMSSAANGGAGASRVMAAAANSSRKQGVAQVLNRLTFMATLSHMRRINTPMEKNGKMIQPRKLHNSQWGIICPSECFDPETPILMWDGTIKAAGEIVVGDHLIDDAGNAVRVKTTCAGFTTMYEVVPTKKNFMRHTVTDNHILTLKVKRFKEIKTEKGRRTVSWFDKKELKYRRKYFDDENELHAFYSSLDDDNVIDITIEQFESLPKSTQQRMYVFKSSGINWERKKVALDPYILGMWLGDGFSCGYGFATADKELLDKWIEWGAENDATVTHCYRYKYHLSSTINRTQPGLNCNKTEKAPLKKLLDQYGLVKNKHIPKEYLINDRETRLAVLAGLIDTDGNVRAHGHEVRICQGEKNYQIIYDAEFLARSLGFSCHVNDGICSYTVDGEKRRRPYKELSITGPRLHEVPTVLPRKKLNKFDNPISEKKGYGHMMSSFNLIKKDVGQFAGFQLDGNGRFLSGDMTTLHNTPEGNSVGLVKNMALTSTITNFSDPSTVRLQLHLLGVTDGELRESDVPVFLNGSIVGGHDDPVGLVESLRAMRRQCVINVYTSIVLDVHNRAVTVNTEAGRIVRPLWVVRPEGDSLMLSRDDADDIVAGRLQWWQLVWRGVMEYVDVTEAATLMIAVNIADLGKGARGVLHRIRYTHMEIAPACILGVPASCIPFSDHNQAPRNTYQASMSKQAIGVNVSNFDSRFDTVNHVLHYPQRALVQTRSARLLHADDLPNGINAMVAIMTFSGYNQEDSVLINRSSIERGLFVSTMFKTFREQNNRNHANGEEEFFCRPDPSITRNLKPCDYSLLQESGFVQENTMIKEGDVIIGKCMPQKVGAVLVYRDNSVSYKGTDRAFVDRNCHGDNYFPTTNGDGYSFAKTRVRCMMEPVVGDKFSSRHAQKGTCGRIVDEWDMPFTEDGVVPDIIVNAHAIPSRMTVAQLLEGVLAKAGCVRGSCGNGSPFQSADFSRVQQVLQRAGYSGHGDEVVHDPLSGRRMTVEAFLTPTYYQRLKHLSSQKVHSRGANGPVVLLTRQPTEGRSREGALRLGNMETHVLVAHGIFQFLKERFMECSDNFKLYVCNKCGYISDSNPDRGIFACRGCGDSASFSETRIPYAAKLLLQEMTTLAVGSRIDTN